MCKNNFLYLLTAVILLSAAAPAQSRESGAFGAPVFKYTRVAGKPALVTGVKGGWIINKRFVLGAGYYVLTSNVSSDFTDTEYNKNLLIDLKYGGLDFEYLMLYNSKYNLTINMLLAGGGLSFYLNNISKKFSYRNLLVWEPQINFEIELYKWLHADAGVSYRLVSSYEDIYNITKDDLQGLNIILTFKLGKY
jgi:hypothetical protein